MTRSTVFNCPLDELLEHRINHYTQLLIDEKRPEVRAYLKQQLHEIDLELKSLLN